MKVRNQTIRSFMSAGVFMAFAMSLQADYYVARNGTNTDTPPYDNWGNAASNIQTVVVAAPSGSTIWVGDGTYSVEHSWMSTIIDITEESLAGKSLTFYGNTNNPERVVLDGMGTKRGLFSKFSAVGQTLDVNGFTFSNCYNMWYGGGINFRAGNGKLTVQNCVFVQNVSETSGGGAVALESASPSDVEVLFSNCVFSENTASFGGALYVTNYKNVTIVDCRSVGNSTTGAIGGGAFMVYESKANFFGCTFFSNRCENGTVIGGGALGTFESTCALTDCHFEENEAIGGDGGAINTRGSVFATNCVFRNNRANTSNYRGGAMWVNPVSPQVCLYNCLVVGNLSNQGTSQAIYGANATTSQFVIVNSTIVSNSSGVGVLGNWAITAPPTIEIRNSIIRYNQQADGTIDNYGFYGPCIGKVYNTATAPALETAFDGGGNTLADPKFVSLADGDFHLQLGSPCIDTGLNQDWMLSAKDLDGRSRLDRQSQKVDMGCYEFQKSGSIVLIH